MLSQTEVEEDDKERNQSLTGYQTSLNLRVVVDMVFDA
jgi:hypothetical protein